MAAAGGLRAADREVCAASRTGRPTRTQPHTSLTPLLLLPLQAVEYIIDDEFVEITPDAIRMGKREKEKDKSGRVKK